MMNTDTTFRWLGVAGFELNLDGCILLVDPYLSRIPLRNFLHGKIEPNSELVSNIVQACDFILITHCHFDHFLDVPEILIRTGAAAFGSPNTCQLLRLFHVPESQIHQVKAGDCFSLGAYDVEVYSGLHTPIPGVLPGRLQDGLCPPLTARQYRIDEMFCYRIGIKHTSILTDPGLAAKKAPASRILLTNPYFYQPQYKTMLKTIQPQTLIPIHWDDFFRPLSYPIQPNLQTPRLGFPPRIRVDLSQFRQTIHKINPDMRIFVPEILKLYPLDELL